MEQTAASIVRIKDYFDGVIAPDWIIMVFMFGEDLVWKRLGATETEVEGVRVAQDAHGGWCERPLIGMADFDEARQGFGIAPGRFIESAIDGRRGRGPGSGGVSGCRGVWQCAATGERSEKEAERVEWDDFCHLTRSYPYKPAKAISKCYHQQAVPGVSPAFSQTFFNLGLRETSLYR
jgi:hypothetical protein